MAGASISLVKLQDQLTCGRCHNIYTKPKTLSCLHSFCQECIEGFPTIPTFFVACPVCHQHTELPDHAGAAGFSVAPQIIDLRCIYEEAKKQSIEAKCANCSSGDSFGFCKNCNQFLCEGCIDTHKKWAPFANHVILSLEEALKVSVSQPSMDKGVGKPKTAAIQGREAEIREQGKAVKEEIRSFLNSIGDKFIKEVDEIVEKKLQILEKQREVSPSLEPIEKPDIQFIKGNSDSISHHVGKVVSSAGLEKCVVKEIATIKHLPEEKAISFELSIESPDDEDSLLVLPASSLSLNVVPVTNTKPRPVINARVIPTDKPGVYQVICTPVIRGRYEVTVKALGIQLGTHRSLLIPINPYTDDAITPVRTIYGVCAHHDVAISFQRPSRILVSETGSHVISVFNKGGQKMSSIGKGQDGVTFSTNQGIAVAPNGYIFVADYGNHRIQKIRYPLNFRDPVSVGSEGAEPLQFNHPVGIAISPIKNRVYVADYGNKRVQVLNEDLTFCRMFGKEGKGNGEFGKPHDIAIDSSGFVYVSDSANCLVQKFTHDGKFLSQFGKKGSGPGELQCPVGIAVDNAGLVYVTENVNHRVSIFTDEGVFVRSFGEEGPNEDQFKTPYFGLMFDEDGYLYICDTLNKRLVVY